MNGIFIARGPHIRSGRRIDDTVIYDIAPTVLHLMGVPVPSDMDGKVIETIFERGFLEAHPVVLDLEVSDDVPSGEMEDMSDSEKKEIGDRLRALGYLA